MSESVHEPQFEQQVADKLYSFTSVEMQKSIIDSQHPALIMDTQAAIRKPGMEGIDSAGAEWGNVAVVTAENYLSSVGDADTLQLIYGYTMGAGIASIAVDALKRRTTGKAADTSASNAMISRMLDQSAFNLVVQHRDKLMANKNLVHITKGLVETLASDNRPNVGWLTPKISMFWDRVHAYMGLDGISMGVRTSAESLGEVEQLQKENDSLFTATKLLQKYDVKPAVAPTRMDNNNIREWLVEGERARQEKHATAVADANRSRYANSYYYTPALATFASTDQRFTGSNPNHVVLDVASDKRSYVAGMNMTGLVEPVDADKQMPDTAVRLGKDGHLYSLGDRPLKTTLQPHIYEVLRADILSLYTDLVVPVYIYDKFDGGEIPAALHPTELPNESPITSMRRLVLSRERIVREAGDNIIVELDKQQKDMAKHDVIGHIRDLPSHYRASSEARALCWNDLEIVLPEMGQTYVRNHKRGNIETDEKGHVVTYRHAASTAISHTMPRPNTKVRRNKKSKR